MHLNLIYYNRIEEVTTTTAITPATKAHNEEKNDKSDCKRKRDAHYLYVHKVLQCTYPGK